MNRSPILWTWFCMLITFGRSFYLTSTAVTGSTDLVISIDQDFNVSMWKSTDADETNANPYESSQIIMQDGHPFQVNSDIPLIAAVTTVNNSIEQTHIFFVHTDTKSLGEIFRNNTSGSGGSQDPGPWVYGQLTDQQYYVADGSPLTAVLSQQQTGSGSGGSRSKERRASTGQLIKVYYQAKQQWGTDFSAVYTDSSSPDPWSWRVIQLPIHTT